MTTKWKDLNDMLEVANAQALGWEIEYRYHCIYNLWAKWDGVEWCKTAQYRGRPKQPKTRTVTSECWRNKENGQLAWREAEWGWSGNADWQRFPAGDFVGEVDE